MSGGFALHPEALADLDDIRDYIAHENPDAADRVMSGPPAPGPEFSALAVRACT